MKILLLGREGQVGTALGQSLDGMGALITWDRASADFEDPRGLAARVRDLAPEVIVNAAAYTEVDRAENDSGRAYRINAEAVGELADYARTSGAFLVHYSTDYVFDGTKQTPYTETDSPNPLNVYGRTKLAGDEAIRASGCDYLVLRTSWVFAAKGRNFPNTILRLATERDTLHIVDDQIGAPTSARLIAEVTRGLVGRIGRRGADRDAMTGIYNVSGRGETSWYEYARFIVEQARSLGLPMRLTQEGIVPVATTAYPQPAIRPANSRLDSSKLESRFGMTMPPWQTEVARVVSEIVLEQPSA